MSDSKKVQICKGCALRKLDNIMFALDDIPILNENFYTHHVGKNNNCNSAYSCMICQEKIHYRSPMYKLKCGHKFHAHCLVLQCAKDNRCPVCRKEVFERGPNIKSLNEVAYHVMRLGDMFNSINNSDSDSDEEIPSGELDHDSIINADD